MGGALGRNWYQRILEGGEQDAKRKPRGMHRAAWEPRGMGQSHVDYSRDTGKVGSAGCRETEDPKSGSAAKLDSKWKQRSMLMSCMKLRSWVPLHSRTG